VALCTIGSCHTELGQYEEALKYLDQDLGIARELKDLDGEATTLGNMGNVLYSQGNAAMASNVYLACQRCAEEAGDQQTALLAITRRGQALCAPDTFAECAVVLLDGMRLAQRLDDQENIADVYKLLGHMYLKFHCFETGGGNSARAHVLFGACCIWPENGLSWHSTQICVTTSHISQVYIWILRGRSSC
jgi:tetratricopeptide (TPR) repeat protein